jgi:hypothetical protein
MNPSASADGTLLILLRYCRRSSGAAWARNGRNGESFQRATAWTLRKKTGLLRKKTRFRQVRTWLAAFFSCTRRNFPYLAKTSCTTPRASPHRKNPSRSTRGTSLSLEKYFSCLLENSWSTPGNFPGMRKVASSMGKSVSTMGKGVPSMGTAPSCTTEDFPGLFCASARTPMFPVWKISQRRRAAESRTRLFFYCVSIMRKKAGTIVSSASCST